MLALQRISSYATVLLIFCSTFFSTTQVLAQAPEGVNYQAVARNNAGDALANQTISVRFSIIANSTSGAVLYSEEHSTISTNDFGLFNLIIGRGNRTGGSATNFAAIDWSSGNRFLKVEVDAGSGFENLGTTQLLSVPYALYAKSSGTTNSNLKGGDGIIVKKDSIINDGDLSETNELITTFSLETGNILRITEASQIYDVDLTSLIPANSDNQNLKFSPNGDSILIDGGKGIKIQFILDDIAKNQTDISNLTTDINTLKFNFTVDSSLTIQNHDSINTLVTLIGNATDNQNLNFNAAKDTILIDRGNSLGIKFITDQISTNKNDIDSLQKYLTIDTALTYLNRDSIRILKGLIDVDNDADSTNEIQGLTFADDSLKIGDPTGRLNLNPIFLGDYNTPEDSTRIANGLSRIFIPVANDSIRFMTNNIEAFTIKANQKSHFKESVGILTPPSDISLNVLSKSDGGIPAAKIKGVGGDTAAVGLLVEADGKLRGAYGIESFAIGRGNAVGIKSFAKNTSATDSSIAIFATASGSQNVYSGFFKNGNVYIGDTLIIPTGAGNGRVLTSDANGLATWGRSAAGFGNVFTDVSSNTGNTNRVAYWINSDSLAFFDDLYVNPANNRVGIGTTNPTQKLQVNGGIRVSSGFNANPGTAGLPAFRFETDSNTGMFSDAADELAFSTNSNEVARFDANGNVGIGTTPSMYKLDVNGSFSANTINVNNNYTFPSVAPMNTGDVLQYNGTSLVWAAGDGTPDLSTVLAAGSDATNDSILNLKFMTIGSQRVPRTSLEIDSILTIEGNLNGTSFFGSNLYNDGTDLKYLNSGSADAYFSAGGESGIFHYVSGTANDPLPSDAASFVKLTDTAIVINGDVPNFEIRLKGNVKADSLRVNGQYSFPNSLPNAGEVMQYDGTNLVWTAGGGTPDLSTVLAAGNDGGANSIFNVDTLSLGSSRAPKATLELDSFITIQGSLSDSFGFFGANVYRTGNTNYYLNDGPANFYASFPQGSGMFHYQPGLKDAPMPFANVSSMIRLENDRIVMEGSTPNLDIDIRGITTIDSLSIDGKYSFPTTIPNSGDILVSDAFGNAEWSASTSKDFGSGALGQLTYFVTADSLRSSPKLFWDEDNDRLRIGTITAESKLTITGNDTNTVKIENKIVGAPVGTPTAGLYVQNSAANGTNYGIRSFTGGGAENRGIDATASGGNNALAVYGSATSATTINTGGYFSGFTSGSAQSYGIRASGRSNASASYGIKADATGTGTLNYGAYGNANGAASINYGVYGQAINGTTNYAGYFAQGDVFVNDTLILNETFRIANNASVGKILVSDAAGNATWKTPAAVSTCPTGMVQLSNTNICIDSNERAPTASWFTAAGNCAALGYKLPSWAEWYGALTNVIVADELDNWEWVDDGTSNTARKVGYGSLKATANDNPTNSAAYRCIYYK